MHSLTGWLRYFCWQPSACTKQRPVAKFDSSGSVGDKHPAAPDGSRRSDDSRASGAPDPGTGCHPCERRPPSLASRHVQCSRINNSTGSRPLEGAPGSALAQDALLGRGQTEFMHPPRAGASVLSRAGRSGSRCDRTGGPMLASGLCLCQCLSSRCEKQRGFCGGLRRAGA